jgi:hypothetical protein
MRIECTTAFLDGRERFEAGDIFTVDDTRGAYFVQNKWAKEVGAADPLPSTAGETDLVIQNATMGHRERKHG